MRVWCQRQSRRLYRLLRHPRYRRRSRVHDWIARHVFDRELWRPEEKPVAAGLACGLFICMLPVPLQMFLAVAVAIRFRWNIPCAAIACWVTSPLTWPITFLPAFLLGVRLTDADPALLDDLQAIDLDHLVAHLTTHSSALILAGLVGCLVVGAGLAGLGYVGARLVFMFRKSPPAPPRVRPGIATS